MDFVAGAHRESTSFVKDGYVGSDGQTPKEDTNQNDLTNATAFMGFGGTVMSFTKKFRTDITGDIATDQVNKRTALCRQLRT